MNIVAALLLLAHGIAHIVGFVGAWELSGAKVPHYTTVMSGQWEVGETGIRLIGVGWLFLSLLFVAAAAGAVVPVPWWPALALGTAAASLVMCLVEWPRAKVGVAINTGIIVLVLIGIAARWPIGG